MAEANYAEFYKAAIEAAGGAASVVFPTGRYRVKIATVKPGTAKGGKFQVGIRFECLEENGTVKAGDSTWINQTLTVENPKAFGVFLKYMLQLGVPQSALDAGAQPDSLPGYIVIGTEGYADFKGDREYPVGTKRQDLGFFHITSVPSTGPGGMQIPTGPVVAAAAPIAVPVPVAVPVSVPAQAVVEAAPVAPAADLAAQLAALQAQIAAAGPPAPSAPAPALTPAF